MQNKQSYISRDADRFEKHVCFVIEDVFVR